MSESLELELGTPQASRIQEGVQNVLVEHDLAMKDDTVMAEYVTVMMANRKGPDMIAEELRELIGGELDASITQKIWKCACDVLSPPKTHAQERARSASPPPPPQQESTEQRTKDRWNDQKPARTKKKRSERNERRENVDEKPASVSILGRAGVPDPRAEPFMPMPPPLAAMTAMAAMSGGPSLFSRLDPMMPDNPPPMPGAGLTTMPSSVPRDMAAFPHAPVQSALCRWSLQCTNPMCEYSHPSPANAGRGGDPSALVLRTDACEHGAECTDKECVLSHVSPAVGFIKARGSVPPPSMPTLAGVPCKFQQQCLNPACTYLHYDAMGRIVPPPGQGNAIPCRFGSACTRPDCVYSHPPKSQVPCRYGSGCTRPGCFYTHPQDAPLRPTSDRLKAFATEDPDCERIVPEEQAAAGVST